MSQLMLCDGDTVVATVVGYVAIATLSARTGRADADGRPTLGEEGRPHDGDADGWTAEPAAARTASTAGATGTADAAIVTAIAAAGATDAAHATRLSVAANSSRPAAAADDGGIGQRQCGIQADERDAGSDGH